MQWLLTCEGLRRVFDGLPGVPFYSRDLGLLRPKMLRSPLFRDELNVAEACIPSQLHCHQEQKEPKRDDYPELLAEEVLFFFHAGGRDLGLSGDRSGYSHCKGFDMF